MPDFEVVLKGNVSSLDNALNKAQSELAQTAVAANKLDSSLQKGAKGTNSATLALSNLGRVAQDAPFGFLGISNNLNPLLESFQRLRAESGSNSKALKALGSSLLGAGGLGFAISVVSSLLVVFGDKLFSSSKAADAAKDSFDGLLSSTAKEALKLKESFAQITDANIPLENRKNIIKELRSEYGVYLKNISDEALLTGQAAAAYDLINNAIFKKLQLQALEEKILPFIKEQINTQFELNQSLEKTATLRKIIDATAGQSNISRLQKDNAVAIAESNAEMGKQYSLQQKIKRIQLDINKIFGEIKPLLQFDDVSIKGITPEKIKKAGLSLAEQLSKGLHLLSKEQLEIPLTFVPVITLDFTKERITRAINAGKAEIFSALENISLPANFKFLSDEELARLAASLNDSFSKMGFKLPENFFSLSPKDRENLENTFKEISGITEQLTNDIFGKIAENLGNFKNPFAGIFEILGESLTKIGKYVIFTSTLLSKVTAALNAALQGLPGAGIAVGIGLLALGQVFKNIPHMAAGGIVPPGYPNDSFPAMLQSNEAVIPLDRMKEFGGGRQVVVLEMIQRGNDNVIRQARNQKQYERVYGIRP